MLLVYFSSGLVFEFIMMCAGTFSRQFINIPYFLPHTDIVLDPIPDQSKGENLEWQNIQTIGLFGLFTY